MKRALLFCLIFLLLHTGAQAQRRGRDGYRNDDKRLMHRRPERKHYKAACPRAYIGFSTGINNPVGIIGPQLDIAATPTLSFSTGIGSSTWGYKTYIEGRYYFSPCNRGWALAGGLTYNTGDHRAEFQEAETFYGKETVRIDERAQVNFMLSGYYFLKLGHAGRNRFHVQLGYSIPLSVVHFDQIYGDPITQKQHDVFDLLAPGGLVLGIGFSFGLGAR